MADTSTITTVAAPTQALRDLIEGNACAMVTADELHNALLDLETLMGWTLTKPTEAELS
ncbi:hypothetical protein [Arthrobacter sp. B3I4]|jgi:hypothetical protein|uniref:hypothetical protein n=1 Tax=Arthrobacter sp. B3I4 TaxID=3042267 RepID=UPI00278651D6|nr:hypothetical protein [Arthrobacter sp. B3I4]MDQ0756123.1 hypothetical protein [Arthrobacter sp. B3I4]